MKVFLYWLISLTLPLMLPSLTSADTIIFKDGMIVDDIGRTWRDDGQVKWATSGITIGYPEVDVDRVEKTPIEEDSIETQPIANKKIKKEKKPISIAELESKGVRIEDGLVCNKFRLVTKVTGSTLDLSVDTDLPDNTVVMVSVSRSYLEKVNTDAYSVDYFSEKSTIGEWKSKHRISVDSENWKSALREKQEKMSRLGLGFDVASISEKIAVRMVVPIYQPDPRFGKRNSKLTGKAVRATGLRVVEDEIEIDYPLDLTLVGASPFPNLNPLELEVGQTYFVTKQTPLMPSHSPADPIAALQKMKLITAGGGFKVP